VHTNEDEDDPNGKLQNGPKPKPKPKPKVGEKGQENIRRTTTQLARK